MLKNLSIYLSIGLIISIAVIQLNATEYPSPPTVPTKFESADDVQRYLNQLHNYYLVVGRPRFGKRSFDFSPFKNAELNRNIQNKKMESSHLFSLMDLNGDDYISREEFNRIVPSNEQ